MTKELFLQVIAQPEIPMKIWFEYYKDRGGILEYEKFEEVFSTMLMHEAIVQVRGTSKQITLASAFHNFYNYYASKFGLT